MNWNLHHYYTNRTDGLMGKLLLSIEEDEKLLYLRNTIRKRITNVFEEIGAVAKEQAAFSQKVNICTHVYKTQSFGILLIKKSLKQVVC
ncbi:hypothetical protein [Vibrio parahaemolyticus]|uniref:hypothetical protein n=1 Tax=Vibrio parahaemolyticus TaxID=670 RepID=UPI0023EE4BF4|nr:hypothetical protein [Vibrio parahaemolyticus]